MKYLNISLKPLDCSNTIHFYGETVPLDYNLLNFSLDKDYGNGFHSISEAMLRLMNQSMDRIHINLFVEQVNVLTYGAIHGFLRSGTIKQERPYPSIKRLMVWVFDGTAQDYQAYEFYEN